MIRRAAIYTRISLDRDGRSEAPERQEADCRAEVVRRGWDLTNVYCDRDASAFKTRARRPEFDRMIHDLRDGQLDAVLVWKLDRLTRQGMTAVGTVIDILTQHNGVLVAVQDGLDTSQSSGRLVAGVLAELARAESENTSTRVKGAHRANAAKGAMHGGGSRQFGYDRSGGVVDQEAAVVREIFGRVLDGESLRQIAFDLNDRGITTTMGKPWRSNTVTQMMQSPRLAGLRSYNGELFAGTWQPILTSAERTTLLAALDRPLATRRSTKSRNLLTGLVVCGVCKGPLRAMKFQMKNGKSFPRYQCIRQPGEVNCGGVAVAKNSLEAFVTNEVLGFLSRAELRPVEESVDERDLELAVTEDSQALAELTQARFVHRSIRPTDYDQARRTLEERLARSEDALLALRRRREEAQVSFRLGDRAALDTWWKDATSPEKRDVLSKALARVEIHKAERRGGNQFNTDRIHLRYRWDLFVRAADKFEETATPEEVSEAARTYGELVDSTTV